LIRVTETKDVHDGHYYSYGEQLLQTFSYRWN